jgi:D-sedoheptulose 7-phosphate isomerase
MSELERCVSGITEDTFIKLCEMVKGVGGRRSKIIVVGNGGSAAICSHFAVDATKNLGLRTITFNESSLLTCFGNDYGYDQWVVEALKAYAEEGDLLILISSSGESPNIVNAARWATQNKYQLIVLSGFKESNQLNHYGSLNLWVNSDIYNIVENTHQIWLLSVLDFLLGKLK